MAGTGPRTGTSLRAMRLAAFAGLLVCLTLPAAAGRPLAPARQSADEVRVTVASRPFARSRLTVGVTHAQHSLDRWGDPAARRRGQELVRAVAGVQNQHVYGWGARNPNPAPGVYDWRSLDRRVRLMRALGGTPVLTLCCAPDWMTRLGTRTSTYPNLAPLDEHLDDFAALAARIARRYPDVRHFMVWNEMKGFFNYDLNAWDAERYTRLYNRVYDALKAVDPAIRVGGPYLVIEGTGTGGPGYGRARPITPRDRAVLDYWLEHKHGADFLAVDRKTVSASHDSAGYGRGQALRLTRWFGSVTRQLRQMTDLPVWFAEDYFRGDADWDYQAAGLASMLREELVSGASVSLRWAPQGQAGGAFGGNDQNLFSDTARPGGGTPFPAYRAYRAIAREFGPGTPLTRVHARPDTVAGVASPRAVLLINQRAAPARVTLAGRPVLLGRYGVRVVER